MANIKLESLTKRFDDVAALDSIDIEVQDKEFFVLLGPTGAGKTTMLRCVSGLEKPEEGTIRIDGEDVGEVSIAARDVAFVFQYYTLYPHMTVRENLEFPLRSRLRRYEQAEIDRRVNEVAEILHITRLLDRKSIHLSGGEMQRVGIGRAIVRQPKVFLMDEPLSNLDAKLREEMRAELARLHYQLGSTFFYVTHDQTEAMTMGDRIAVMHEGKIKQIGTPQDIYYKPADTFVAKFVGSPPINLVEGTLKDGNLSLFGGQMICCPTEEQVKRLESAGKDKVIFGIRPEDILITQEEGDSNSFPMNVYFNQSMGAEDILNLKSDDLLLQATVAPNLEIQVGQTVYANFQMDYAHLFDVETTERIG